MKLATLRTGSRDGQAVVVSPDGTRCLAIDSAFPTLQSIFDDWNAAAPILHARHTALTAAPDTAGTALDPARLAPPLPRAYQWLDGSAFLNHGRLMQQAFKLPPNDESLPLIYQGASDDFLAAGDTAIFPSEEDGIDFEGEFAVVLDEVPMGASPEEGLAAVRLLMLLNDWSLRAFGPREIRGGFGFLQAKPSTAFAPFAVTPDELGDAWQSGRIHLRLRVDLNGARVGDLEGGGMDFSFGDLIAHAARTRTLRPGTILGSGTVSNPDRKAGSACLSERQMIEIIDQGAIRTPFLVAGDRVRIEAFDSAGRSVFGAIEQTVAVHPRTPR